MKINHKVSKALTAALLALSTISLTDNSWASPGGTDAKGCHTSRTSGYHCHNSGSGSGSSGSGSGSSGSGSGSSGSGSRSPSGGGSEGVCLTFNDCMSRGETQLKSNPAQALNYFQQALLLKPEDIKAFTQINVVEPYVMAIPGTCPDFKTCMNLGYAGMKQKDYQTALVNFKRALAFNLGNKYAIDAIGNVSRNIQQSRN
ncbi:MULTISPECIES: YHYH domain-containing protein [unclassified Microcoleus]|uniref:YHYH domain-containing protein n=1 Tax=unclassified Microcoleus TaxID=2642155 RepID=UPI002FD20235